MVDAVGILLGALESTRKLPGDPRDLVRRTCVLYTVATPWPAPSPIVNLQCHRLWREKAPPQSHTQESKHPSFCKAGGKHLPSSSSELFMRELRIQTLLVDQALPPPPPCLVLKCSRKRTREIVSQGVTSFPSQMHHGSHPSTLLHVIIFGLWV